MAMTFVEERYHLIQSIKASWTSDSDGAATATTTAVDWDGACVFLVTIPGSTAAPTADYDLVVTDRFGVDVLGGAGANLSATATEYSFASALGAVSCSPLTFTISNAGEVKDGVVYLRIA